MITPQPPHSAFKVHKNLPSKNFLHSRFHVINLKNNFFGGFSFHFPLLFFPRLVLFSPSTILESHFSKHFSQLSKYRYLTDFYKKNLIIFFKLRVILVYRLWWISPQIIEMKKEEFLKDIVQPSIKFSYLKPLSFLDF